MTLYPSHLGSINSSIMVSSPRRVTFVVLFELCPSIIVSEPPIVFFAGVKREPYVQVLDVIPKDVFSFASNQASPNLNILCNVFQDDFPLQFDLSKSFQAMKLGMFIDQKMMVRTIISSVKLVIGRLLVYVVEGSCCGHVPCW